MAELNSSIFSATPSESGTFVPYFLSTNTPFHIINSTFFTKLESTSISGTDGVNFQPQILKADWRHMADWTVVAVAVTGLFLNLWHLALLRFSRLPYFAKLKKRVRVHHSLHFASQETATTSNFGAPSHRAPTLIDATYNDCRQTQKTFALFDNVVR